MKPIVGIVALGVLAFVLINCATSPGPFMAGANGLCLQLGAYVGVPKK